MGHFGVYTNCQGACIYEEFLSKMSYFSGWKYTFLENYSLPELNKDIIGDFDIFLFQPMDIKHGKYSTLCEDGILSMLKPSCLRISFPSIYADLWPMYEEYGGYYGGEHILKLKDEGKSLEEIFQMLKNGDIQFNLKERYRLSFKYLRMREKSCTIQSISSFIEDNIKESRLFYSQNHPTEDFMAFVAREICDYIELALGILLTDNIEYDKTCVLKHGILYDSIYIFKELGLEYMKDTTDDSLKDCIKYLYNNPSCLLTKKIYNFCNSD